MKASIGLFALATVISTVSSASLSVLKREADIALAMRNLETLGYKLTRSEAGFEKRSGWDYPAGGSGSGTSPAPVPAPAPAPVPIPAPSPPYTGSGSTGSGSSPSTGTGTFPGAGTPPTAPSGGYTGGSSSGSSPAPPTLPPTLPPSTGPTYGSGTTTPPSGGGTTTPPSTSCPDPTLVQTKGLLNLCSSSCTCPGSYFLCTSSGTLSGVLGSTGLVSCLSLGAFDALLASPATPSTSTPALGGLLGGGLLGGGLLGGLGGL